MPTYLYRADQCPAIPVPAGLLSPTASPPVPTTATTLPVGTTTGVAMRFDQNAVRLDVLGRWGGGGYAVATGLELTAGSGLTLNASAGQAMIDGPVTKAVAATLALTDNIARAYVWLSQGANLVAVNNSITPPAGAQAFLGSVSTAGGVITGIDYSGRLHLRGGTLWRRTGDAGKPADNPPAGVQFLNRSRNGAWWWDGDRYWGIDDRQLVTLAAERVTIPAYSGNYRLEADFSGAGAFENACWAAQVGTDEASVVISEELARKGPGRLSLVLYVPLDATAGSYGGPLDLELTATMEGRGWSGTATENVAAVWTAPDPVGP